MVRNLTGTRRRRLRAIGLTVAICAALLGIAWYVYPYFSYAEMFRRSRPALDAYAAKIMASGTAELATPPTRLGYYHVLSVEPLPHGFLFQHDSGNPFDWNGLAYSTQPLPRYEYDAAGEVRQVFTPIDGDWYEVFRARPDEPASRPATRAST
jgi:hypothetical protein